MVEVWSVLRTEGRSDEDGGLETRLVVGRACNVIAPEVVEVGSGETAIADMGGGGVVKGKGKVTKVGGVSCGDGVIRDGKGDRCHCSCGLVEDGTSLEGEVGLEGGPGEGEGVREAKAGEVGTGCKLMWVGRGKAGRGLIGWQWERAGRVLYWRVGGNVTV